MGMPRKPRDIPGVANIDLYWEQFSEAGDKPNVSVNVVGSKFDQSSVQEMRKIARYMNDAASWLQHQIDIGKL